MLVARITGGGVRRRRDPDARRGRGRDRDRGAVRGRGRRNTDAAGEADGAFWFLWAKTVAATAAETASPSVRAIAVETERVMRASRC